MIHLLSSLDGNAVRFDIDPRSGMLDAAIRRTSFERN